MLGNNDNIFVSDEKVLDICSGSREFVHGSGHIVHWPLGETTLSCSCYLYGAAKMSINTFSPLYNTGHSKCSSRVFINGSEFPCQSSIQEFELVAHSTTNLTLLTAGYDRLWVKLSSKFQFVCLIFN